MHVGNIVFDWWLACCRWKGSVYKLVWRELLVFLCIYFAINLLYRHGLNEPHQRWVFERLSCWVSERVRGWALSECDWVAGEGSCLIYPGRYTLKLRHVCERGGGESVPVTSLWRRIIYVTSLTASPALPCLYSLAGQRAAEYVTLSLPAVSRAWAGRASAWLGLTRRPQCFWELEAWQV